MLLKERKIISIKIIVMQLENASFSQGVIFLLFIKDNEEACEASEEHGIGLPMTVVESRLRTWTGS